MHRNDHYQDYSHVSANIDQRSYQQQQYAHSLPPDPLEEVLGIFPCGITVIDIIFFVRDGKTTGEAVVLFSSIAHYEAGIQRNHQHMGRRYVEVFQAKRADYYLAASLRLKSEQMFSGPGSYSGPASSGGFRPPMRMLPAQDEHTGVIRMRGLPFNVTVDDILSFFRAFNLSREAVKIACRYDNRPTGEAYVCFDTPELAAQALALDRGEIGSRYIELFPSTADAFARI